MKLKEKNIVIWHSSGRKYFGYLDGVSDEYNFIYKSYVILRTLFGFHPSNTSIIKSKFLNPGDVNIVCIAPFDPNILFLWIQKKIHRKNKKYIMHTSAPDHYHGYYFSSKLVGVMWRAIAKQIFDEIVIPNGICKRHIEDVYEKKTTVIEHPVLNYKEKKSVRKVSDIRIEKSGIEKIILFVGEISYKKGFDRFVARSISDNRNTYIAIGKIIDYDSGMGNVKYMGYMHNEIVQDAMLQADILLCPSRKTDRWEELFGIAIIEAIENGCYVYASNHIGPEYILSKCPKCMELVDDEDSAWSGMGFSAGVFNKVCCSYIEELTPEMLWEKWKEVIDRVVK
jgi:glycosyltransferase involved in cell wall biosynthesis